MLLKRTPALLFMTIPRPLPCVKGAKHCIVEVSFAGNWVLIRKRLSPGPVTDETCWPFWAYPRTARKKRAITPLLRNTCIYSRIHETTHFGTVTKWVLMRKHAG